MPGSRKGVARPQEDRYEARRSKGGTSRPDEHRGEPPKTVTELDHLERRSRAREEE